MKSIIKKVVSAAVCTAMICSLAFVATACKEQTPLPTVSVTLNENTLILDVYEAASLYATTDGGDAVQWSVSDPSVASISANGNECTINALKGGSTVVTASSGGSDAVCNVTVDDNGIYPNFTLDNLAESESTDYELSIINGGMFDILSTFSFNGETRNDFTVSYSTENKGIISVSEEGQVKGLKEGTENLTAVAKWNGNTFPSTVKTVEVTVTDGFLALSSYKAEILYDAFVSEGGDKKSFDLNTISAKAYISGEVKENVTLSFDIVEGANLVTLSNNIVASNCSGVGEVRIAVSANVNGKDLKAAYFKVNVDITSGIVTAENSSLKFMRGSLTDMGGVAYTSAANQSIGNLTVKDYNGNPAAVTPTVIYTSSNEDLVTVDQSGNITLTSGATVGECSISVFCLGRSYNVCSVSVKDFDGYKVIANLSDLNKVTASGKYVLVNDVDLDGRVGMLVDNFAGVFDGNGYALKNGVIYGHKTKSNTDFTFDGGGTNATMKFFSGTVTGTIRNIAFSNWKVESTNNAENGSWSACALIEGCTGTIENVYVDITVNAKGTHQCNAVLVSKAGQDDKPCNMKNILINATFAERSKRGFGSIAGEFHNVSPVNVYAVITGVGADEVYSHQNVRNSDLNYASLLDLQETKPELFSEGGAFTDAFWKNLF